MRELPEFSSNKKKKRARLGSTVLRTRAHTHNKHKQERVGLDRQKGEDGAIARTKKIDEEERPNLCNRNEAKIFKVMSQKLDEIEVAKVAKSLEEKGRKFTKTNFGQNSERERSPKSSSEIITGERKKIYEKEFWPKG